MPDIPAWLQAAALIITAAGSYLAAQASKRRGLEQVVDDRMELVLDRQDKQIEQLREETAELKAVRVALEAETTELRRVANALERLCSRLIRAVKPYDPDTALEVESELTQVLRGKNGAQP